MKIIRLIGFFAIGCVLLAAVQCSKRDDSLRRIVLSPEEILFHYDTVLPFYISVQPPGPFSWALGELPEWAEADATYGSSDGEIVKINLFNNPLIGGYSGSPHKVKVVSSNAGESTFTIHRASKNHSTLVLEPDSIHFKEDDDVLEMYIHHLGSDVGEWYMHIDDDWLISSMSPETGIDYSRPIFLSIDRTKMPPNQTTTFVRFVHEHWLDTVLCKVTAEYFPVPVFGASINQATFDFTDQSVSFWVKNTGGLVGIWRFGLDETMFEANPTSGSLAVNDSVLVNLSLIRDNLPDGIFLSEVKLLNNSFSQVAVKLEIEIRNYNDQIHTMFSNLAHTEYDYSNNHVVAVTSMPNKLLVINPENWGINDVQLVYAPNCVAVASNSNTAFVGHNGKISQIDLQFMQVEHVFQSSANVRDIFAKNNNWVYYTSTHFNSPLHTLNTSTSAITQSNQTLSIQFQPFLAEHLHVLCIPEHRNDKFFNIENGEPIFIGEKERGTQLAPRQISNDNNHLVLINGSYNIVKQGNLMDLQHIGSLTGFNESEINTIGLNEQTNHGFLNPKVSSGVNRTIYAYDLNTFALMGQNMLPDFLLANENGEPTFYPVKVFRIYVNNIENKVILIVEPQGYHSNAWGIIQFDQDELLHFNHINLKRK